MRYPKTIVAFARQRAEEITGRTHDQYLMYAKRFEQDMGDMKINKLSRSHIIQWKDKMLNAGLCRNTVNYYLRGLRAIYNRAVMLELTKDNTPFKMVSCNNVKTAKRAITQQQLRTLAYMELEGSQRRARDMFMLSFYLRGIAPVDLAKLKTQNVVMHNKKWYIRYKRSKTSQELCIEVVDEAKEIINKYLGEDDTLLDIPNSKSYWDRVNKSLKSVGSKCGVSFPLTMYCARHTWATLSQSIGTPIEVISKGLGHDNIQTTAIYLADIETPVIDKYNSKLISQVLHK